jgi:tetratricopeptide (TPR) repeat protein
VADGLSAHGARELLTQFCGDLRLLRAEAGGPSLRVLGDRLQVSKSQLGAVLNGQIKELPDWRVVRGLVECVVRYAHERGRANRLSLPTGLDQFWSRRYAMVEHAFDHAAREPIDAPATAAESPVVVVPRQLPAAVRSFVGRDNELAALTELLGDGGDAAPTLVITAIGGTAGVGKTALAVQWAHQIADRFPDGQLYVNLRGFDPGGVPVPPAEVLRGFLDAFAVPAERIPAGQDAQAALYRSVLADKRVLVVLDNARDPEQVRPLLPATPGCLAVITSRNSLAGLVATHDVQPVIVGLLTFEHAHEFLIRRLGRPRVMADRPAAEAIIQGCARLPLALAIVCARASLQPSLPLGSIAAELDQARESLDGLAGRDPAADLRGVFSWSYDTLTPDAARLFRLLALAPGAEVTDSAAASLVGCPLRTTRTLLSELIGAHLLTEQVLGRYSYHDLLRAYALEQVQVNDSGEQCRLARRRILDHYVHTAFRADRLLSPQRDPIVLDAPAPQTQLADVTTLDQALAWLTAERPTLQAAVEQASRHDFPVHAWQLAWTGATFCHRQGHWREWVEVQSIGLTAARRLGDRSAEALCHRLLARGYIRSGNYDDAYPHLHNALDLYRDLGDEIGQANTYLNIGEALVYQDKLVDSLYHASEALKLFRSAGHRVGEDNCLNNIGWLKAQLGDHDDALINCRQALALHQDRDDRQGEATTWDSLGYIHHMRRDYSEATTCYGRALELYRGLGDRYLEAHALARLGDVHAAAADHVAARTAWGGALDILTELDHPDATEVRAKLKPDRAT